jgi:hypothetical protein
VTQSRFAVRHDSKGRDDLPIRVLRRCRALMAACRSQAGTIISTVSARTGLAHRSPMMVPALVPVREVSSTTLRACSRSEDPSAQTLHRLG